MKNTLETRLGIFVALAVLAAVLIIEMLGGVERFQSGYKVNALFNNIQDLKVGDRVKMAGVEIGRVNEIQLTNNKVLVNMKLRKNVVVKTDSLAKVMYTGLMGQNFVGVEFGSPESVPATEGTYLQTAEQPDLSAVMSKMENVADGISKITGSFTGEKIDNLLGPLTNFLRANQVPITQTIANMQKISSQISEGQGTVGKLIFDDSLYYSAYTSITNLQDVAEEVKLGMNDARAAISDARNVIAQVNKGEGTVGKLLKDEKLYAEATASMTNLRQVLEKINNGQGSVGKMINDQEIYKNAKLTLQKLDKATEGLEDQGPLSVIGLVVGNLF